MAHNRTLDLVSDTLSGKAGCLLFSFLFVLCGAILFWAFFAATRIRSNRGMLPVVALLFTLAGVAGLAPTIATKGRRR